MPWPRACHHRAAAAAAAAMAAAAPWRRVVVTPRMGSTHCLSTWADTTAGLGRPSTTTQHSPTDPWCPDWQPCTEAATESSIGRATARLVTTTTRSRRGDTATGKATASDEWGWGEARHGERTKRTEGRRKSKQEEAAQRVTSRFVSSDRAADPMPFLARACFEPRSVVLFLSTGVQLREGLLGGCIFNVSGFCEPLFTLFNSLRFTTRRQQDRPGRDGIQGYVAWTDTWSSWDRKPRTPHKPQSKRDNDKRDVCHGRRTTATHGVPV